MATKSISTWLSDSTIFIVRLFIFILFGNPLSMFVLNLLNPRGAAKFAKNQTLFGEKIYAYYESKALKWPFFWAKWWMKLEDIAKYPIERQIQYFFKVAIKNKTEVETLKAMRNDKQGNVFWPQAYEILFFKYGNVSMSDEEYRWHIEDGCTVGYKTNVTIAEFMMRNVRLSFNALLEAFKKAVLDDEARNELKKYLSRGKLPDSQFELIINSVEIGFGSRLAMLDILLDYVRRYGISEKHLEKCRMKFSPELVELVKEAQLYANEKRAKVQSDDEKTKN